MEKENIFKRFIEILKPDFLVKNFDTSDSNETWKFWFLSNSIITAMVVIVAAFATTKAVNEAGGYLQEKYPDAKISINNGKLTTEGIEEPIFAESKEDGSIFVVDTQGKKYDESVLSGYRKGTFISSTKIISKENEIKTQQFDISKIKDNFTISQGDLQGMKWIAQLFFIIFIAVFAWIYFNILRLVSALWWAFWFWLLGMIMRVENITFSKVYFAVLNFYIIPLAMSLVLLAFGAGISFLTTVIFLVIFIVNYMKMNKERKQLTEIKPEAIENK